MTPQNIAVSDEVRYSILHSLSLPDKVSKTVDVEIKTLKGPSPNIISYGGGLPIGTQSQILKYTLKVNGWKIAKIHRYVLPNGEIRGGPDPMYIRIDDAVFCRMERKNQ